MIAAQLRSKRTNIVGVSICDLLNPYFAEVAAGIEASLGESGRALFLGNCGESVARQAKFLETLREYKVEGVLLMPAIGTRKATLLQMREWGIPVVLVSRYVAGVDSDYAGSDNRLGSILATQHLLSLGHERIAFIGANRRTSTGRDRTAGFHSALKKAGWSPEYGDGLEQRKCRRATEVTLQRSPAVGTAAYGYSRDLRFTILRTPRARMS